METIKTEVIIVGAGPTDLSLAVQLLRYGINFVIIDKKEVTAQARENGTQINTDQTD